MDWPCFEHCMLHQCMCMCVFVYINKHAQVSVYLYMCVNVTVHLCIYVCACVSLWCAKYLWHVFQRVQNVKIGPMDLCSLALKKGGGG